MSSTETHDTHGCSAQRAHGVAATVVRRASFWCCRLSSADAERARLTITSFSALSSRYWSFGLLA